MSKSRPNFLILMTDRHCADYLGCYGHPLLQTPHIDSIAETGLKFTEFFVASPVCMPNRASIMTGRYPSVHGLRHNGLALPCTANTFVDVLRDAGYHTAMIGKSHLQPMTGKPPNRGPKPGVNPALPEAVKADGGRYDLEEPHHYETSGHFDFPTPYYGFDHIDMVTNHGDQCNGHYYQWLRRQTDQADLLRDRANQLAHNYSCPQAIRTSLPEELYPTSYVCDRAIDYLNSKRASEQPFFAFVSFPDPHHPFTPPGKYWDMYSPSDFEVELPFEAHQNLPPHLLQCYQELLDNTRRTHVQANFMATRQELREAMALSCGMITMIDDAVGEILNILKANGQLDNTVIIFLADHGDYLGEFSLLLKGPIPLRSINRVPFIWSDPLYRGSAVATAALGSSLDIAPTIIERAGLKPYYGIPGKSLLSLLEDPVVAFRDRLLIEHEDSQPKAGFPVRANIRTLLTAEHRLSIYADHDWGELYDHTVDPNETLNLWDDPAAQAVKQTLLHQLADEMIKAVDQGPWPERLA